MTTGWPLCRCRYSLSRSSAAWCSTSPAVPIRVAGQQGHLCARPVEQLADEVGLVHVLHPCGAEHAEVVDADGEVELHQDPGESLPSPAPSRKGALSRRTLPARWASRA